MYLKGSFTVEGTIVISICMVVIALCILLAFEVYEESLAYLERTNVSELDVVERFRLFSMAGNLFEELTD